MWMEGRGHKTKLPQILWGAVVFTALSLILTAIVLIDIYIK